MSIKNEIIRPILHTLLDNQNTGFVSSYPLAEPAKFDSLVIDHLSVVGSVAHEADDCLFQALKNRNARISAPFK